MKPAHPLDVATVGESLGLLTATQVGSLQHVKTLQLGFGGAESNVAIGVARLGGTAAWIGRVGTDPVGRLILRELRAEGVEAHAVVDEGAATALMLKEHSRPGVSRVAYYRRGQAGSRLHEGDLPADVINRAKILHITGITAALGDRPRAALHAAITQARQGGAVVSFDVNHRSTLWDQDAEAAAHYRELARRADIVFAGEDEAQLVTGRGDERAQTDALLALGADQVVIKRGARGAVATSRHGAVVRRDAHQVSVIDTVGAGDAFVAGWLAEHARGSALEACLAVASACGALACTSAGDWEGAPTRPEVAQLHDGPADPVLR